MYPSNSRRSRGSEEEPRKVTKLISGSVSKREKPLLMRIFGESEGVGNYILWDILIPAFKDTILDMIRNGSEMIIFGETRTKSSLRRDRDRSYVSYGSFARERERREPRDRGGRSSYNRGRHNFDDIIIDTRGDAETVLENLVDLIEEYGQATVADFYGFIGMEVEWSDNKFGWETLNRASIRPVRGGYIIELPKAIPLD